MANPAFAHPFNDTYPATVAADGTATVTVKLTGQRVQWQVEQVSLEMPTAPPGATVSVRYNGALVAPAFDASQAAIGGDPPLFLRPGDTMTVEWIGCTPGDRGNVLVIYRKVGY